jgi:hypothetical protein
LITRKADVLNFRIRKLQQLEVACAQLPLMPSLVAVVGSSTLALTKPTWLSRTQALVGREPEITALLSCYKLYCPHQVAINVTSRRKNWFPVSDPVWREAVIKFHRGALHQSHNSVALPSAQLVSISDAERSFGKRLRVDNTASAIQRGAGPRRDGDKRLTLRQVENFEELTKVIDRVASPAQVATVLNHELAQFVVLYVGLESIRCLGLLGGGDVLSDTCP